MTKATKMTTKTATTGRRPRVVQIVNDELVRMVASADEGIQLFSRRKLRKAKTCRGCRTELPARSDAFGDVTSCAMNRADRYCLTCCGLGGLPTLAQCEAALGEPAAQWAGRCFEIASRIVKAGLIPSGVAVYGHYVGRIDPASFFGEHINHRFVQHGWVNLHDGLTVFDPTRWAFEAKDPYLYVGCSGDYDEGGNRFRMAMLGEPPEYDPDEKHYRFTKTILDSKPWTHVERLLRIDVSVQEPGDLTDTQVGWLSNAAFDLLQPYAFEIYAAICHHGLSAHIPIDNRRHAERLAGKKLGA